MTLIMVNKELQFCGFIYHESHRTKWSSASRRFIPKCTCSTVYHNETETIIPNWLAQEERNTFYRSLVYNFTRFMSLSTLLCTGEHILTYLDCKQIPWMHIAHTLTICRCNNSYRAISLWHLINVLEDIHFFRILNEFSVHELLWFTLFRSLPSVPFNFCEVYTRARLNVAINILSGARAAPLHNGHSILSTSFVVVDVDVVVTTIKLFVMQSIDMLYNTHGDYRLMRP